MQLTPEQRKAYTELTRFGVAQAPGGQLTADGTLALAIRQQQCVGGFLPHDMGDGADPLPGGNPKVTKLLDLAEMLEDEKLVVWARFDQELDAIATALVCVFGDVVCRYNGRMTGEEKQASKRRFIDDHEARFFVAQTQAGGTGLDGLQTVCKYMVFFSNLYPYYLRLQAISRLARTEGSDVVQVWDLVAEDSVDEAIAETLQAAQDVSEAILKKGIK